MGDLARGRGEREVFSAAPTAKTLRGLSLPQPRVGISYSGNSTLNTCTRSLKNLVVWTLPEASTAMPTRPSNSPSLLPSEPHPATGITPSATGAGLAVWSPQLHAMAIATSANRARKSALRFARRRASGPPPIAPGRRENGRDSTMGVSPSPSLAGRRDVQRPRARGRISIGPYVGG